jgi:predicted phage-related endonuclease
MALTGAQLARRRERVWASEVPMILSVSPWGSEWDVWVEKVGLTDPEAKGDPDNEKRLDIGHLMEEPLLQYAQRKLGGVKIVRNPERLHPGLPLGAHLDAIVTETGEPIEAKNIYFSNPHFDAWGDEGTGEVAEDVIVQVHAQMMCQDHLVKAERVHVVANVGGDFRLYEVARSQTICDAIAWKVEEFWENVQNRREPCGPRSLEVARALKRESGKVVRLDAGMALVYQEAQEAAKFAAQHFDQVKADVLAAMGDAEIGDLGNGQEFSALVQSRKGYTVEPGSSRVLRLRKSRG